MCGTHNPATFNDEDDDRLSPVYNESNGYDMDENAQFAQEDIQSMTQLLQFQNPQNLQRMQQLANDASELGANAGGGLHSNYVSGAPAEDWACSQCMCHD